MTTELSVWLRRQRRERNWGRQEMARELIKAAREAGDRSLPNVGSMCHNLYRWERGPDEPCERYQLYYCRAFGISTGAFGPQPEPAGLAVPGLPPGAVVVLAAPGLAGAAPYLAGGQLDPALWAADGVAYGGGDGPDQGRARIEREVHMAAQDGSDQVARFEGDQVGEATLGQLRADVVRLSRLTDTGEPFAVFGDLRRVRERAYQVLDRRLWPRDQADLHFLLGCLNALMGLAANRLGYPDAAEELMRAGWAHATAADHRPLSAHVRYQLSYVEFNRGQIRRSRDLAASGLSYASSGRGGAGLHLKYARAAARLGEADEARRAVLAAHEAQAQDEPDDLLEIGGEFAISHATHYSSAGGALAQLKGAEKEAAGELEQAISLYEAGPGPGEDFWFGGRAMAGIDLAAVRLRAGALDAATAALDPVFALPPAQRVTELTQRLGLVRKELRAPIFRRSIPASDLNIRIEEFTREAVAAGLHGLSAG